MLIRIREEQIAELTETLYIYYPK